MPSPNRICSPLLVASLCASVSAVVAQTKETGDELNILLEFKTVEILPDGTENRLLSPRVTTKPGMEAMISVSDAVDYFQFKVKPDWQDGKIAVECAYEDGRINLDKDTAADFQRGGARLAPGPPLVVPRPRKTTQDRTFPQKRRGNRPFPKNLHMTGFARIPGKPPRVALRDLNDGVEFWIHLGKQQRDIRFISVDYAQRDPVALLQYGRQFAEVRLSSPVLKPVEMPLKTVLKKFSFSDVIVPGETVVFDIGTSQNGHPQRLQMKVRAQTNAELEAILKNSRPAIPAQPIRPLQPKR